MLRTSLIIINIYAMILQPAFMNSCSRKTTSGLQNESYSVIGPAKTYVEVQAVLDELNAETTRWLSKRDNGQDLSWAMTDLSDSEVNRLWLHNLLEAKEKIPKGASDQGLRAGIYINKINNHIEQARNLLEEDIKQFNQSFFEGRIGSSTPLDTQLSYLKSLEYSEHLTSLDKQSRDKEVEIQLALLNTIDTDFKEHSRSLIYSILLNTGIIKSKTEGMITIEDKDVLRNFWDGYSETLRQDFIALHEEKKGTPPQLETFVQEIEKLSLTPEQSRLWEVYKYVSQAKGALADVTLETLSKVELDKDKEITEEILIAAFKESLESLQEDAEEDINNAFPNSMDRLTKLLGDVETAAAEVKFALTSLVAFPQFKVLYGVILTFFVGLATVDDWDAKFSSPVATFGSMIGITFTVSHVGALSKFLLTIESFKKVVTSGLTALESALSTATKIVPAEIARLANSIFSFASNQVQAIGSGLIGRMGAIILKSSPVCTIGMFLALSYEIYSLTESKIDTYKAYLGIVNVGLIGTMTILGVASGFYSIPGINVIFLIGTIAWFVISAIKSYAPTRNFEPNASDPTVQFFANEIHPEHSYWQWCNEASESLANCQKDIVADIPLGLAHTKEILLKSNSYGGGGGSNELSFESTMEDGSTLVRPALEDAGIIKIEMWTCASGIHKDEIGFSYETLRSSETCLPSQSQACKAGTVREYHMGCGSDKGDRRDAKSMDISFERPLTEVRLFVTELNVRTARAKAIEFCTADGCVGTHDNPEENYPHVVNFANITTYGQGPLSSKTSKGEIIGFHGKHGVTIDSLGIYLRLAPEEVYKPEQRDESLPWFHSWDRNGVCIQSYNDSGTATNSKQQAGICKACEKYVSFEQRNGSTWAQCEPCSYKSGITDNGICMPRGNPYEL